MHPAPSVIIFTVLSGLGFGFLGYLNLGLVPTRGLGAMLAFGVGYGFAVIGLLASTFHLGRPERALRAFTQWRTSWLSREAWVSVAALLVTAPVALEMMGGGAPGLWGLIAGFLCLATVGCTSMIYAQLKTVPRWNHWSTPALFFGFALTGGAILSGLALLGAIFSLLLTIGVGLTFRAGDRRFAAAGSTLGTATGLGTLGEVRVFEQAHTAGNYLMREMIHVVGRKHATRLRGIALIGLGLPAVILLLPETLVTVLVALTFHLIGAFAARWLFFAQAEHVVGLYYGQR